MIPNIEKPLCVLDVESTGVDPASDRIIQFAVAKFENGKPPKKFCTLIDPGFTIPKHIAELTGVTDERVADAPMFEDVAAKIHRGLMDCDLVGFNLLNFDVPIIWEELYRAKIEWDLSKTRIIDAGNIFKKKEPRTLEAAVKKYCGREHTNGHDAMVDVMATAEVLSGQRAAYPDISSMSVEALHDFSQMDELDRVPVKRVDLAGLLVRDGNGVVRYTHKKVRGVAVKDDPGYAEWMLRSGFSANTKMAIRKVLEEVRDNGQEQLL